MNPRVFQRLMTALGAMAMVSGCDLDSKVVQSDGRTAGGSDEIDTRIAVDRTGKPVVGARIALVKTGDSSGTALAVSATGSDGAYPTFVVPDGYYSLLVRDSSGTTGRYVDSVRVVSRKLPTGRDTLLSLGSVSGVVRLLSGDSPTSVRLGLVGTDILSSAMSDGTFKIDLVPGGLYTLGAESSLDGYDRIYRRIQLKDGQNLVLPDTLVLPFTGLPVPVGLRVSQDTATGNVGVSWSRVDHPDFMGYVLERVEGGVTTYSRFLTDTIWTDTLGAYWERLPLLGPWPNRNVTYRVRSRSVSGAADTRSVAFQFQAKPPHWTRFVGNPTPRLTQDSTTGNVQVTWSAIRHPQLKGYVVDRIENGGVQSEPIQADTTFVDSLGAYWESLPLLGPWPERKLEYRIRLIAKDGGIEVFGDSTAMDAKPPVWTKHVDSVKVMVTTDSVTGVTELKWSALKHPDLVGWTIHRYVNGVMDCADNATWESWTDSLCGNATEDVVGTLSLTSSQGIQRLNQRAKSIEFFFFAKRRIGNNEPLRIQLPELSVTPWVVWRDSALVAEHQTRRFIAFGPWLAHVSSDVLLKSGAISNDGLHWEAVPHKFDQIIGIDDSVWTVSLDSDSFHLVVSNRVSVGVWNTRRVGLNSTVHSVQKLFIRHGRPGIVAQTTPMAGWSGSLWNDSIFVIEEGDSLTPSSIGGFGPATNEYNNCYSFPISSNSWVDYINGVNGNSASVTIDGVVVSTRAWKSGGRVYGTIDRTGVTLEQWGEMLLAVAPHGPARQLPLPSGVDLSAESEYQVFRGEIWLLNNGRLWKGNLNLPK